MNSIDKETEMAVTFFFLAAASILSCPNELKRSMLWIARTKKISVKFEKGPSTYC